MTTSHTRFHPLRIFPVALALVFNVAFGPLAPVVSSLDRLTAQAADAPVVTLEDGVNGCMGVRTTPGSENTDKKLVSGTLEPGSTVTFEISYPVSASDVSGRTTFVITDCVFINDTPVLKYSVSFVPNTENYILTYNVPIPSNAPIGGEYCNYAKTTAAPSDSPASNRKAGPACFIIGGALRVLKVDQNGDPLAGADFTVSCTPPTTTAYLPRIVISAGGQDYSFVSQSGVTVNQDVTTGSDGVIAVQAPDATSCTFTETSPPPGYLLASPASHTMTVNATEQQTYTFVDKCPLPDLSITKVADATPVTAGDDIGFTITVSNSNDADTGTARNVTLNDPLPAGVSWSISPAYSGPGTCSITSNTLGCSFGDLAKGDSVSVHITATTSAAACSTYPNTATASADNNPDVADSATIVCQKPAISVAKTADAASVNAGEQIGFTVTISNTGDGQAKGLSFSDSLPAGTGIDWSISPASSGWSISGSAPSQSLVYAPTTLAANSSTSVHVVSGTTKDSCKVYDNTAQVSTSNDGSDEASAETKVQCPDVKVVKTADAASVNAGEQIGFTVTISNTGDGQAKGLSFSDSLPAGTGIDWSISPASSGWSISGSAPSQSLVYAPTTLAANSSTSVHVVSGTTKDSCKVYDNTAQVSTSNDGSDEASAETKVQCPDVKVVKTADAASVNAGEQIGFTMTVTNLGPGAATDVSLSDTLPSASGLDWSIDNQPAGNPCTISAGELSCRFGDMAANASVSIHITSPTTGESCGIVMNTADVSATNEPSSNLGNNEDSDSTNVICPDVTVVKTADNGTISAGDTAAFTIVVSNIGEGTAYNVTLDDPLPAGVSWNQDSAACTIDSGDLSCSWDTLAPGGSATIHVWGQTDAADCGVLDNTATVAATNEAEADTENNSSSADITVECPSLSATKTADASPVSAGNQIGFTITVSNSDAAGTGTAHDVALNDPLPAGANLSWSIADQPAGNPCSISGSAGSQTLECSFGDLASGASVSVHVVSGTATADCSTLPNVATVTASNNPTLKPDADVTVECPGLNIAKTAANSSINGGDIASFTIKVWNVGSGTALGAQLDDPLPDGGGGLSWSIDPAYTGPGTCTITGEAGSQTLHCDFGDLAGGTSLAEPSASITVVANTTRADCGTLPNEATASASNSDAVTADASIDVTCPVIEIVKSNNQPNPVLPGTDVTYTLNVAVSDGPANDVTVVDTLPFGLDSPTSISNSGVWSNGTRTITWHFDSLDNGDPAITLSYHAVVSASDTHGQVLTNNVSVTGTNTQCPDTETLDAKCQSQSDVSIRVPTLVIDKAASVDEVHFVFNADGSVKSVTPDGAQVTWTLTYTLANGPVTNAVISDPLPDYLTFVSAANGGTYDAGTRTVTWQFATLSASGSVSFLTTVDSDAPETGPIVNVASIVSDQTAKDTGEDGVRVTSEQVQAATPTPSVPNTAVLGGQNGQPIQIPIELLVVFFLGSLGALTLANVKAVRRRRR